MENFEVKKCPVCGVDWVAPDYVLTTAGKRLGNKLTTVTDFTGFTCATTKKYRSEKFKECLFKSFLD